jgi:hypothetical protein
MQTSRRLKWVSGRPLRNGPLSRKNLFWAKPVPASFSALSGHTCTFFDPDVLRESIGEAQSVFARAAGL